MYFVLKSLQSIMENVPAIICSDSFAFSNYRVDQMKKVACSQIFRHIIDHVRWMN